MDKVTERLAILEQNQSRVDKMSKAVEYVIGVTNTQKRIIEVCNSSVNICVQITVIMFVLFTTVMIALSLYWVKFRKNQQSIDQRSIKPNFISHIDRKKRMVAVVRGYESE